MNESNPKRGSLKAGLQFAIALVVVLAGVTAGTMLTLRFEGPRPANKPTALGHQPPNRAQPAPAVESGETNDASSVLEREPLTPDR